MVVQSSIAACRVGAISGYFAGAGQRPIHDDQRPVTAAAFQTRKFHLLLPSVLLEGDYNTLPSALSGVLAGAAKQKVSHTIERVTAFRTVCGSATIRGSDPLRV